MNVDKLPCHHPMTLVRLSVGRNSITVETVCRHCGKSVEPNDPESVAREAKALWERHKQAFPADGAKILRLP